MTHNEFLTPREQRTVRQALTILDGYLRKASVCLSAPDKVRDFLRLRLEGQTREMFTVLFLDNQNQLLKAEELFFGTLAETAVYPREIARQVLLNNAAAVIVAHNHPSGTTTPSTNDVQLTRQIREALALIDVRLLDHFIIGSGDMASLAELGQL